MRVGTDAGGSAAWATHARSPRRSQTSAVVLVALRHPHAVLRPTPENCESRDTTAMTARSGISRLIRDKCLGGIDHEQGWSRLRRLLTAGTRATAVSSRTSASSGGPPPPPPPALLRPPPPHPPPH